MKMNKMPEIPLQYRLYDYMLKNNIGYINRIKSNVLMEKFNINDNKQFRKYIQLLREDENIDKIICSEAGHKGGYWIATDKAEVLGTMNHLYKRAMEMLKVYAIIKRKSNLNGQMRYKMNEKDIEIIESILER